MPDNPNENKFMAMLERKGIVRKAGSEDEQDAAEPVGENPRVDTDFRAMLGPNTDDAPKVTPAARQPVPGMINPVIPSAQPQQSGQRPQQTAAPGYGQQPVGTPVSVRPQQPPQTVRQAEPEQSQFARQSDAGLMQPIDTQKPAMQPGAFSVVKDDSSWDEEPFAGPLEPAGYDRQTGLTAENCTDRYLDIDELYEALSIRSKRTDTVYLVEEYLKTLPDSLPDESRREIVTKIVAASGFDFDLLMGDGVLRVKMLKEYAEQFAHYTDDYVSARNNELEELEQQILRIRKLIEGRRELHKKQFFTIEAEAQRLKEILTFISG